MDKLSKDKSNTDSESAFIMLWDQTQMLKKFPLAKMNNTKNALFFLLQAPTHHSFTFNLQFLWAEAQGLSL